MSPQPAVSKEAARAREVLSGEHVDRELPSYWPQLVQYSYLRELGHSQQQAAEAVGRAARTTRRWEADTEVYQLARISARMIWNHELNTRARRRLAKILDYDIPHPDMIEQQLKAVEFQLERGTDQYAPPEQQVSHEHKGSMAHLHGVVELPEMDQGAESRSLDELQEELDAEQPTPSGDGRPAVELPELDEGPPSEEET